MAASAVANATLSQSAASSSTNGLVFSISPCKKQPKSNNNDDDEKHVLTLAPFTKPPKISFGQVKVNEIVERYVLIINPQQFKVDLNIVNQALNLNNYPMSLEANQSANLKISWQPDKPDNYKYTILFEVTNNAKLKFIVHAYGICLKPEPKKAVRKPFSTLQPIRKEPIQQKAAKEKEANITTIKASMTSVNITTVNLVCDKTIVIDDKENGSSACQNSTNAPCVLDFTGNQTTILAKSALNNNAARFNDDNNVDLTPKPSHSTISRTLQHDEGSATPKLAEYLKPNSEYEASSSTNFMDIIYSQTAHKMDMTRQINVLNVAKVVENNYRSASCDEFLKTPNFDSINYKKQINREEIFDNTMITSTANQSYLKSTVRLSANTAGNQPQHNMAKTPRLENFYNFETLSSESDTESDYLRRATFNVIKKPSSSNSIKPDELLIKYAILVQKAWRYKKFRRALRIQVYEASKRHKEELDAEVERLVREQSEREKLLFKEIAERERHLNAVNDAKKAAIRLKFIVICQRLIRMKRFRKYLAICREVEANRAKCALIIQRQWRMKLFRRNLHRLRIEAEERQYEMDPNRCTVFVQRAFRYKNYKQNLIRLRAERRAELEYQAKLLQCTITCQKLRRYKQFKRSLVRLQQERQYQLDLLKCTLRVQRSFRYRKFRQNLSRLRSQKQVHVYNSATIIQRQWRLYKFRCMMCLYRKSVLTLQHWFRNGLKYRVHFICLRERTIRMQRLARIQIEKRNRATVCIQSAWRMYKQRKQFNLAKASAVRIQRWFRSKKPRLQFLKLKRSLPAIQFKCRLLVLKQQQSAVRIQRTYRYLRFRRALSKYRNSAITIQKWTRLMKNRYELKRLKRIAIAIQSVCRGFLDRRLAMKMAHARSQRLRLAAERQVELEKLEHLHRAATRIQALWRGFIQRKNTSPQSIIHSIRSRLSIYQLNTACSVSSSSTLGARIKASLETLKYPCVSIQQIMMALTDLVKVTHLSPECCRMFVEEGAVNTLYTFINSCNRSVPHMDLVKLCLQVFINLARYSQTYLYILKPEGALSTLMNLMQAYFVSNPTIFMHVCILLSILVSKYEETKELVLTDTVFVKKLEQIQTALQRRAQFNTSQAGISIDPKFGEHSSIIKKSTVIQFTLAPDWSLGRNQNIELTNSIGAIDHIAKLLNISQSSIASSQPNAFITKTPRKTICCENGTSSSIKKPKLSSASSLESLMQRTVPSETCTSRLPCILKNCSTTRPFNSLRHETVSFSAKKTAQSLASRVTASNSHQQLFKNNLANKEDMPDVIYENNTNEETIYYETNGQSEASMMIPEDDAYFTAFSTTVTIRTERPVNIAIETNNRNLENYTVKDSNESTPMNVRYQQQ